MVVLQDDGDGLDLTLKNLNEDVSLGNGGRWVACFEIIVNLIITSLLDNHVIIVVVLGLSSVSLGLVLLLLLLNMV